MQTDAAHAVTKSAKFKQKPQPDSLTPATKGKFASITDPKGVGALMRAIRGYQGTQVARLALQLAPLVFARPGELRAAEWREFDLEAAEWMIPAERAKKRCSFSMRSRSACAHRSGV